MSQFFGGDCYVIKYSYPHPDYKNDVIYYWQVWTSIDYVKRISVDFVYIFSMQYA